jgi:hypothetical protein
MRKPPTTVILLEAVRLREEIELRQAKLSAEVKFASAQEKQKAKGKSPAKDWKVQTGGGGAFVLKHKESGDYYAGYATTPITSWGAKRFVTVKEAYAYLNDSKNFTQGSKSQSSWNRSSNHA